MKNEKSVLELSFEYLMAKDTLQWISVKSEQVNMGPKERRRGGGGENLPLGLQPFINPFMPNGISHPYQIDKPLLNSRVIG